jgi:uncharacterized protein (TIGR03437 family)
MNRKRKLFWAKTGVIMAALPFLMWAYEYGPDAGYSGVPKESGTCNTSGCHVGTNVNAGGGSVSVAFPNGLTYTPGVKQHLVVTIADPAQRAWGFQLTPRLSSASNTMAGSVSFSDTTTQLMCADANLTREVAVCQSGAGSGCQQPTGAPTCPTGLTLQYMEHSLTGYNGTKGKTGSATYEFDWTPPATDVGNVVIYVAGNAANGDLTQNGDHIYTNTYTLTPAAAGGGGNTPTITDVVNGANFQPGIEAGSWVTIKGTNLANTDPGRTWRADEIVNNNLPTSLDNVSVTINNKPAYVYFISPTQINVQAPSDSATGSVSVVVKNNGAASAAFPAQMNAYSPAFFQYGDGTPYVIATRFPDNALIANPATAAFPAVAAKAGDIVILWATGFGATSPDTPAGIVVAGAPAVATAPTVTVGGVNAPLVTSAVLSPGSVGLYQIAIQLPANVPKGAVDVVGSVGGFQSISGAKLFVGN